ncbi:hypothetical protein SAMN05444280_11537 [Tangfeifania diversioriginum]|uniref:Uncharacterized protein n=1 Tax=Tangfeifania diversioriginum TaxID=1168035 RepID=A0A1M6I1B4_9BACT|nr:DUF6057 family protein [Tangfeifania diversioriginum]SHJ28044.1 hypothetical protein SAMN05444280_11537 [Tangfeifania diversioriginum]
MRTTNLKTSRFLHLLPYLLFFTGTVFYFYWFANYIFFYQEKTSLFLVSFSYLKEHFDQPGGFLEYLGSLVSAFYYHKFTGPVLMGLIIFASVLLVARIAKIKTGKPAPVFPFLIGAGMVYLQANYQYAAVNNLGIFLQLLFFYLTLRFFRKRLEWIPVLLFPGWYILTGGFSWIFLVLFAVHLVIERNEHWWKKIVLVLVLSAAAFFISMEFLFYQTPANLLVYPIEAQQTGMQLKELAVLVFIILLLPVLSKFKISSLQNKKKKKINWVQFVPFIILIGLAFALVPKIDKKNSHYFHVEELFYKQQYEKLIAFNEAFPSTNRLTIFLNNIALAETGQLTDRLFEFPQDPNGGTLFLEWEMVGEVLKRGGYFYYTVGIINEAQRWAYEYMVMRGYTPEGLKMLIKTELINGNYEVAQKYIHTLKQTIFYRQEARAYEKLLFDDEAVDAHPELGEKKRMKPESDFFVLSDNPAANLRQIVSTDSTHLFALEYQFAWQLLQKDIEGIVENLPLLEKSGYRRIPRHIQEAAAGYKQLQMGPFPELGYLGIDPQIEQRFRRYYQVFQQNSSSRERAHRALYRDFSDTFWFYLFFK